MKKIILVLSVSFLIFGCANRGYTEGGHGNPIDLEKDKPLIMETIKFGLKDPDSLKNLVLTQKKCFLVGNMIGGYVDGSKSWCVWATYGAKNSYGGYVRGTSILYRKPSNGTYISTYDRGYGVTGISEGDVKYPD